MCGIEIYPARPDELNLVRRVTARYERPIVGIYRISAAGPPSRERHARSTKSFLRGSCAQASGHEIAESDARSAVPHKNFVSLSNRRYFLERARSSAHVVCAALLSPFSLGFGLVTPRLAGAFAASSRQLGANDLPLTTREVLTFHAPAHANCRGPSWTHRDRLRGLISAAARKVRP